MELVSYATKKKEAIANKTIISKNYEILGSLKGEIKMAIKGEKSKNVFSLENFNNLAKKPVGEINANSLKDLVKQAIIDISSEQAQKPPLYKEIYEEIFDASFPASLDVKDVIGLMTAFSVVGDGESVPLADFKVEDMGTIRFKSYAAGYSITEEWVAFNQFWKIGQANKAIGQAYNAILDHIHLSPIFNANYVDGTKTDKDTTSGATALQKVYNSLRKGLQDSLKRRNSRGYIFKPSILLCNSATSLDVFSAIKGETEKGKTLSSLGLIEKVVVYDGWAGNINGVDYDFLGPKDNEVYLIEPKNGFKALVKKECTRIEQKGNVLTLGHLDVVEFFIRALVADVRNCVHKVIVG